MNQTPIAPCTTAISSYQTYDDEDVDSKLPRVIASTSEEPPPTWFTICKYYLVILNAITFGALALVTVILILLGLLALFNDHARVFVILTIIALIVALLAFYQWKVPIEGALKNKKTPLTAHGVIMLLFLAVSLVSSGPNLPTMDDPRMAEMAAMYENVAKSARFLKILLNAAEVASCFFMIQFIRKQAIGRNNPAV